MTQSLEKQLIVIGAGGHARVVIDVLKSGGLVPGGCLDADRRLWGRTLDGVPILGGDEYLSGLPPSRFALVNGLGAALKTAPRSGLFERLLARGYQFPPVVAASAYISPSAVVEAGAQVFSRAVLNPGVVVAADSIVNTGAIVEHDCRVGAHAHVCPGAILCGGVELGAGAFVGSGAVVLPGIRLGPRAVVAAGVVVRKDINAGGRAMPERHRKARTP